MKKVIKRILIGLAAAIAALFAVYYFNLDMKLMHYVVLPFLDKHHDSVKREHVI
ncbi:MAG: hypothetical protein ACOX68_06455 [Candidatus Limivicinus sp.]|jgi:uncharacterized protein YxeA